jgi:mono/diheme cytochrome c family protein
MIGPMRVTTRLLLALAIPTVMVLTGAVSLAYAQPSPDPSGSPTASGATTLPGDPAKGAQLYAQDCAVCHGANLEGGIGPALNPIEKLPGVPDPLDPTFLIGIITNGRAHQPNDPRQVDMPPKGGHPELTQQDVRDIAAYIIQTNHMPGGGALSPGELAKRTILWVSIAIIAMGFITYLLSAYNMRWIARRAAARRK